MWDEEERQRNKEEITGEQSMETCTEHTKLSAAVARLEVKIDFLVEDRKEQRKRYEKKKSRIRKIYYSVVVAAFTCFGYLFEHRESVRLAIKEWLK